VGLKLYIFFRNLFGKQRLDRELDEEIRSYIDLTAAEKIQRGMKPEDALREARRELGGSEQVKESVRDTRMGRSFDTLLQDLRYGLRMLVKHRSFTFVTILTLALGIGACTAIFSLVNAVLIHSLPYGNAQRLVYLWGQNRRFAMFLAIVGIYGLLAYAVRQRSEEIGIRMALGSSRTSVVRLMLRRTDPGRNRRADRLRFSDGVYAAIERFSLSCTCPRSNHFYSSSSAFVYRGICSVPGAELPSFYYRSNEHLTA
jgi:hypothetical protein